MIVYLQSRSFIFTQDRKLKKDRLLHMIVYFSFYDRWPYHPINFFDIRESLLEIKRAGVLSRLFGTFNFELNQFGCEEDQVRVERK